MSRLIGSAITKRKEDRHGSRKKGYVSVHVCVCVGGGDANMHQGVLVVSHRNSERASKLCQRFVQTL